MRLPSFLLPAVLAAPAALLAQVFLDSARFSVRTLHTGIGVISVQSDSEGRIYACEKRGRVLVLAPDGPGKFKPAEVFADLSASVDAASESGLLGLALDPAFAANGYLYVFYTTAADTRLMRLRADSTRLRALAGEPAPILTGLPHKTKTHQAGDIAFDGADTNAIYLALGDDNDKEAARDSNRYEGKILKVSKISGQGMPGNPFIDGDLGSVRSRVWATGFRNPFRMVFHGGVPGVLFISENGGPEGQRTREDRVARVEKGADCAWSTAASTAGATSPWFAPADPKCKVLLALPPVIVGLAIARQGAFTEGGSGDVLYLSSWNTGISRYRLSGPARDQAEPMDEGKPFATQIYGIHMAFGPDDALYVSNSLGDSSVASWMTSIRRIESNGVSALPGPRPQALPPEVERTDGGWRVRIAQPGPYALRLRGLNGRELGVISGQGPAIRFLPNASGGVRILEFVAAGGATAGRGRLLLPE